MTDLVTFGEATLRLRAEGGHRLGDTDAFDAGVGGPECNAAVTASTLGADAVWLSRLPESPLGERVVADLRSHGVRTGVTWADDASLATAFVEAGAEPRGRTTVHDRDGAAFEQVHAANLPAGVVQDAERFHVAGPTLARSERAAAATESLFEGASEAGTTTSFDLRYRAHDWSRAEARAACESLFPHVDVLFVAIDAAESVFDEEGDPIEIAHALRTDNGFETVVLCREDGGALAVHGDEVHETDAIPARPSTRRAPATRSSARSTPHGSARTHSASATRSRGAPRPRRSHERSRATPSTCRPTRSSGSRDGRRAIGAVDGDVPGR